MHRGGDVAPVAHSLHAENGRGATASERSGTMNAMADLKPVARVGPKQTVFEDRVEPGAVYYYCVRAVAVRELV